MRARMATLIAIGLFTLAPAGGARAGESTGGLALGTKVPAAVAKTKMKNVDGKMMSIADATGRAGTLVVFTCNHCPFAKAWEERIVELGNTYATKGVGVILGRRARVRRQRHARGVPVRQDGQAGLPRHDRRQPPGARQGEGALPEGRAGCGGRGQEASRSRDQGPRLQHQVPQLIGGGPRSGMSR